MIPLLTAQEARKLARRDLPPDELSDFILRGTYAEIYASAVCGHRGICTAFTGIDSDEKRVARALQRAATQLRAQGFQVDIQGGAGVHISWEVKK